MLYNGQLNIWTPTTFVIAELRRPEGPPSGAPYTYRKGKERKHTNGFSHGYHGQRYCSRARTHDGNNGDDGNDGGDGDDGDGVTQDGGHSLAKLEG